MSDFNIQFEEQDQSITLEFEQIGGGAVKSVNEKTGVVVLDADDVGAYTKPSGGIPKTDLASAVQTSLGKADSAYQKPAGGIPANDIAFGVVPVVDNTLTVSGAAADAKKVGDEISTVKDGLTSVTDNVKSITQVTGIKQSMTFDGAGGKQTTVYVEAGKTYTFTNITPEGETVATGTVYVSGYSSEYSKTIPSRGNSISLSPLHSGYLTIYKNGTGEAVYDFKLSGDYDTTVDNVIALTADLENITGNKAIVCRKNYYYNTGTIGATVNTDTPGNDAHWESAIVSCVENDVFTINGFGATAARSWAWLNSSKVIIANESGTGSISNKVIKAPENTAYLIINNKISEEPDAVSYYGEIVDAHINRIEAELNTFEESVDDDFDAVNADIDAIADLLPYEPIASASYIQAFDVKGAKFTFNFTQQTGNRVYIGGKNFCKKEIVNLGASSTAILSGNDLRGIIVPIKGGLTYTISRSANVSNRFRVALTESYPANGVLTEGDTRIADTALKYEYDTSGHSNAKYMLIYLSNSGEDVTDADYQVEIGAQTDFEAYNGKIVTTNDASISDTSVVENLYAWCDSGNISAVYYTKIGSASATSKPFAVSNTGNMSIVCAKEHRYIDGTQPVTEGYVVEECNTRRFFFTKDFSDYKYLFTASIQTYQYAFAMLANGDVIACKFADMLIGTDKSDDKRENPYCWLASEKWAIQHEVDFGESLKPCGWLQNCGFKLLADGHGMFGEYTRPKVATANVWKLIGSPDNPDNWVVKKSFDVTSVDNQTGFKHIHMIEQDCYNGTIYLSTGDDNDASMLWCSTDGGETWTKLYTSEKYCRNLSFTFTEDYIYWAPDTQVPASRYLFKVERDVDGIIDMQTVVDYVQLTGISTDVGTATYGISYIPELNCILILDKCDGFASDMRLDVVDLTGGTLVKVAEMHSVDGEPAHIGFRTRYSEYSPKDGKVHIGFGFRVAGNIDYVNHNKGFGNIGYSNIGAGLNNINNMLIGIKKVDSNFTAYFDTIY